MPLCCKANLGKELSGLKCSDVKLMKALISSSRFGRIKPPFSPMLANFCELDTSEGRDLYRLAKERGQSGVDAWNPSTLERFALLQVQQDGLSLSF
jgi:hypothetical protein